jgi:hypothetical protein
MAKNKITLNELRSIVRQVIEESIGKGEYTIENLPLLLDPNRKDTMFVMDSKHLNYGASAPSFAIHNNDELKKWKDEVIKQGYKPDTILRPGMGNMWYATPAPRGSITKGKQPFNFWTNDLKENLGNSTPKYTEELYTDNQGNQYLDMNAQIGRVHITSGNWGDGTPRYFIKVYWGTDSKGSELAKVEVGKERIKTTFLRVINKISADWAGKEDDIPYSHWDKYWQSFK